jgi:hypothetical protein
MTLRLELSAASSNLPAWLTSWEAGFAYNGNGYFNGSLGTAGQWWAGNATYSDAVNNGESSVILNGTDFDYGAPGNFSGHPQSLELGKNLWQDLDNDLFKQDTELSITVDGGGDLPITNAFRYTIYGLSHGGQVDGYEYAPGQHFPGLTDYFAEQGTHQIGTSAGDVLQSFGGNDLLHGALGNDRFVFADGWKTDVIDDFGITTGTDFDTLDLRAVSSISTAADLFSHSNYFTDPTGVLTIVDGTNTLTISNLQASDLANLFSNGQVLLT